VNLAVWLIMQTFLPLIAMLAVLQPESRIGDKQLVLQKQFVGVPTFDCCNSLWKHTNVDNNIG
jgi:hypothetical protein